ncbi:MAG: TIGR02206 family membrane protein [Oscillospiraceae bacterium]|nr:TIGR02206 family membrane protein [Oscillospiraceae bacterium]
MQRFFHYFFGAGNAPEFAIFTLAHAAPILVMLAVIFLIWRCRDRLRGFRHEPVIRYVLAFALILSDMTYYWRLVGMPSLMPNPVENLPLGVCGWAVIFCSFMVVGKIQSLFDIAYFWLLSGSLFALITPTPLTFTGPTRFRYYQFWLEHTLGYIAIFYMIFVHDMRPTVKSAVKSYVALAVMAVIAYGVNTMIPGANYLYMARPESAPSVLDILPPNFALRICIMALVITLMYGLAYLPWYLKDRKAQKTAAEAVEV